MQLDMANFTLQMIRPDIINHSVELEREKFAKYLAVQAGEILIIWLFLYMIKT